jgi:tetratricopeptide (TPR) repeat protein
MTDWLTMSQQVRSKFSPRAILPVVSAVMVSLSLWGSPSLAKDPFRTTNPRPISDRTENAFRAFFERGDYPAAAQYLQQAEANEPLVPAMKASLVYVDMQGEKDAQKRTEMLEQVRSYAAQTQASANAILSKDPLRGNLYLAVGHFLQAGYIILRDGTVKGTPEGMREVQTAMTYLDQAEAKSPNDPEMNLIKGYVELIMALNIPFSSPSQAINRLSTNAAPRYLADRGIAVGYRDLNQPAKALAAVDRALKLTPENPELYYLKAQILVKQGNNKESIPLFEKALAKQNQLPPVMVKQIARELDRTKRRLAQQGS